MERRQTALVEAVSVETHAEGVDHSDLEHAKKEHALKYRSHRHKKQLRLRREWRSTGEGEMGEEEGC